MTSADKVELIGQIIDIFEDFLEEKGVRIPNDERDEECQNDLLDNAANIYGMDYEILSTQIESTLRAWDLLEV